MMDRLGGMAVFAKVVETGSFSAAARALGLSKSAVSKQVAALEARLGARLLNRTTRTLSLTDPGLAFHDRAVRILAEAEEAERAVSLLQSEPRGLLRVNAPVTFGVEHLAPLVARLMARHPELQVDLTLEDRMVDLVAEGHDVAVRIGRPADSSLIARKLAPSRRVVVASPDHVARHGAPQRPEDLRDHPCLRYAYMLRGDEWALCGPGGREATVRVGGRLRANNGDALRCAAEAGLGVALMPTFIVGESLRAGRLVRLLPGWSDEEGVVCAVWPTSRFLSPKVRALVDFLAEALGPAPYWEEGLG